MLSQSAVTFDNNNVLKLFKNFNIKATEQDSVEFVTIDDESSHVFQEEILEEQQVVIDDENITSVRTSQRMLILLVKSYKRTIFLIMFTRSLSFYKENCLKQKCKLLYLTTMESYNPLLITFGIFGKNTCQQQKVSAKPKRQATLTDIFLRASISKLMSIVLFHFPK